MTIDTEEIFRFKKPNTNKLLANGFADQGDEFTKQIPIMRKQFTMILHINQEGHIHFQVMDHAMDEEYTLVHVEGATGGFVGEVCEACEKVLCEVAQKCFDTEILKAEQTRRIFDWIIDTYKVEPEYLWEKFPTYAVFRRADNEKWFAIIMAVEKGKLGIEERGSVEIMNLKAKPDKVVELLEQDGFYPAYHMNKKHWVSITLDGTVTDEPIQRLIEESFCGLGK